MSSLTPFSKNLLLVGGVAASLALGASTGAAKDIEVDDVRITAAGNREGRATFTPWSGIWWPLSSTKLAKGWNGTGDDFTYDATAKTWKRATASQSKTVNDLSPLLKYDEYVKRATGTDPGSALYECTGDASFMHNVYGDQKAKYDTDGVSYSWWGHCNGWSAAAVLEKEPIGPIEKGGIKFEVADLKGLLTESFYGVQSDFTGLRYETPDPSIRDSREPGKQLLAALVAGTPKPVGEYIAWYEKAWDTKMTDLAKASAKAADFKDELETFEKWYVDNFEKPYEDLPPNVFHKIIETVIGRKKLALVFDITANEEVWNHPAFAFTSAVTFVRDFNENNVAKKEWSVTTTVHYATDGVSESAIGVSEFTKTYTYKLVTDATGKLLSGTWTGSSVDNHPDFAWLPLSNPTTADSGENKKLLYGKILEILPAAHGVTQARAIDLSANGTSASSKRANDRTTTWNQPVAVSGAVSFTVAATAGQSVAKVDYFEQAVTGSTEPTATRAPLVSLGSSTTGPTFAVSKAFQTTGKKMILAYAYDAASRLVGYDEITLQYSLSGGGTTPTADDIYEPNDSKGTAAAVNPGTYPNLVCQNEDWFKVTLAQPGTLEVKIAFQNSEGDLDMSLEGPSSQVGKSTTTGNEEKVTAQNLAAGTYQVRVYGYGGAKAKYALTVTSTSGGPTPSQDDAYEANNDRASAKALVAGTHSLVSQDDDWFKVTLTAAGTITAKIDFRNAESDLDLYLQNGTGTELAKSDSTADGETVTKSALAAGTYYVQVKKYSGARSLYTMTLTVTQSTTPTPTTQTGTITATTLNIRSGAGTTFGVVTTRTNGQVVTILGESNGFYKLTWTGAPAGELWGSKSYIRINP
ncbi:MAG: pre-peptidase C-terminal domain-containing protein [Planctomycetota bacterium]